jgi:hypothetical protein
MNLVKDNLQTDETFNRLEAFRGSDAFDWQLTEYVKLSENISKDLEAVKNAGINLPIHSVEKIILYAAIVFAQQQLNGVAATPNYKFQNYSKWILEAGNLSGRIQSPRVDITPIDVVEETKTISADKELETIFNGLAKNWREATGSYSLNMRRYSHPTYQALMLALGKEKIEDVVPLILRELQRRPDMWFEALKVITKKNPAQDAKTFDDAVAAWISWGKSEKYI